MKRFTFLSLVFLFASLFTTTQSTAQVTEGERSMSQGAFNSLTIELPEGSEKIAPKEWTKFFKKYGKVKKNRKTDEYLSNNAEVLGLSNNSVDVYAKFNANTMTVWFDLGGAYLSSSQHIDGYATAEQILMDFGLRLKVLMVEDELKSEEKKLKNFKGDLEKLEKEKITLEKNIEDWKAKIAQAEADIDQNITDQENQTTAIGDQMTLIEQIKARLAELRKK